MRHAFDVIEELLVGAHRDAELAADALVVRDVTWCVGAADTARAPLDMLARVMEPDPGSGRIVWEAYSQHKHWMVYQNTADGLQNPEWSQYSTPDRGTHIRVYVAQGTHANYPLPCNNDACYNQTVDEGTSGSGLGGPEGEATHPDEADATPWVFNDDDSCESLCVTSLDGNAFATFGYALGLVPPISPNSNMLNEAPGGPAEHANVFEHPDGMSSGFEPGNLQTEADDDLGSSSPIPCCTFL